jgi:hypothetical protein
VHRFFGLTPNDKETFLEEIYGLMEHGHFTYSEAVMLPIWKRRWFIERIIKERKLRNKEADDMDQPLNQSKQLQSQPKLRKFM